MSRRRTPRAGPGSTCAKCSWPAMPSCTWSDSCDVHRRHNAVAGTQSVLLQCNRFVGGFIMDIPVFVTPHGSGFQARMGSPFDLVAEGPTADAALEAVHELLRDKL